VCHLWRRTLRAFLPLDKALEYTAQIADALDKAHREGWCIAT
jgi:hypothetical protein